MVFDNHIVFDKVSIQSYFAYLKNQIVYFLVIELQVCVYVLWMQVLYRLHVLQIFSKSMACPSIFITPSLEKQKCEILRKSDLSSSLSLPSFVNVF